MIPFKNELEEVDYDIGVLASLIQGNTDGIDVELVKKQIDDLLDKRLKITRLAPSSTNGLGL